MKVQDKMPQEIKDKMKPMIGIEMTHEKTECDRCRLLFDIKEPIFWKLKDNYDIQVYCKKCNFNCNIIEDKLWYEKKE